MKKLKTIFIAALAALMFATTPTRLFAKATTTEYISDLMIAYADSYDEAKALLEAQDYTACENALSKSNGVWLGYKTTNDVKQAITDVSVMNMDGGYSFEEYATVLAEENEKIDIFLDSMIPAIEEFQQNYADGSEKAKLAYSLLNKLTNDDKNDQGMGDYFLNYTDDRKDLQNVLLQCSTYALKTMIALIGLGCSVNNWVESMLDYEVDDQDKAKAADLVSDNMDYLKTLADGLVSVASYNITVDPEDTEKNYIEDFQSTASDEERSTVDEYLTAYTILSSYVVDEDEGTTLADILSQDPTEMSDEELEIYYPMFLSMTEGQITTLAGLSLAKSITYVSSSDEEIAMTVETLNDSSESLESIGTVSVFEGVDRSVFTESSIAMTSAAMRDNALNKDTSKSTSWNEKAALVLGGISAGLALTAATLGAFYLYGSTTVTTVELGFQAGIAHITLNSPDYVLAGATKYLDITTSTIYGQGTLQVLGAAFTVVTSVAILTAIAAIVLKYALDMKEPTRIKTEIPHIILDEDSNTRIAEMLSYHVVNDTNGNPADLANDNEEEWYALYYSKKTAAGTPLTADFTFTSKMVDSDIDSSKYRPVHKMGSSQSAAYNLELAKGKYNYLHIGYLAETDTATAAATTVSYGGYALTAAAGAIVGALITFFATKKKKEA